MTGIVANIYDSFIRMGKSFMAPSDPDTVLTLRQKRVVMFGLVLLPQLKNEMKKRQDDLYIAYEKAIVIDTHGFNYLVPTVYLFKYVAYVEWKNNMLKVINEMKGERAATLADTLIEYKIATQKIAEVPYSMDYLNTHILGPMQMSHITDPMNVLHYLYESYIVFDKFVQDDYEDFRRTDYIYTNTALFSLPSINRRVENSYCVKHLFKTVDLLESTPSKVRDDENVRKDYNANSCEAHRIILKAIFEGYKKYELKEKDYHRLNFEAHKDIIEDASKASEQYKPLYPVLSSELYSVPFTDIPSAPPISPIVPTAPLISPLIPVTVPLTPDVPESEQVKAYKKTEAYKQHKANIESTQSGLAMVEKKEQMAAAEKEKEEMAEKEAVEKKKEAIAEKKAAAEKEKEAAAEKKAAEKEKEAAAKKEAAEKEKEAAAEKEAAVEKEKEAMAEKKEAAEKKKAAEKKEKEMAEKRKAGEKKLEELQKRLVSALPLPSPLEDEDESDYPRAAEVISVIDDVTTAETPQEVERIARRAVAEGEISPVVAEKIVSMDPIDEIAPSVYITDSKGITIINPASISTMTERTLVKAYACIVNDRFRGKSAKNLARHTASFVKSHPQISTYKNIEKLANSISKKLFSGKEVQKRFSESFTAYMIGTKVIKGKPVTSCEYVFA